MADRLADAMVSGIYSGDSRSLSVRACAPFSKMRALEEEYGSVLRAAVGMAVGATATRLQSMLGKAEQARSSVGGNDADSEFVRRFSTAVQVSFRDGMQALPDAAAAALRCQDDVHVLTGARVEALQDGENARFRVSWTQPTGAGGERVSVADDADFVISTLPVDTLAALTTVREEGKVVAARDGGGDSSLAHLGVALSSAGAPRSDGVDVACVNIAFPNGEYCCCCCSCCSCCYC